VLPLAKAVKGGFVAFSLDSRHLAFARAKQELGEPYFRSVAGEKPEVAGYNMVTTGIAQVVDVRTGEELLQFEVCKQGGVAAVAFHPDGARLVTLGSDNQVKCWDAKTGKELLALRGRGTGLVALALSPDGALVASGGNGFFPEPPRDTRRADAPPGRRYEPGGVQICHMNTGKELWLLPEHPRWVRCLVFSPDNRHLATGCDDGCVRVWDVAARRLILTLSGNEGGVHSVAFNPDGKRLASGAGAFDGPGEIRVWDVAKYLGKP
jgi:WD40 repeat protein